MWAREHLNSRATSSGVISGIIGCDQRARTGTNDVAASLESDNGSKVAGAVHMMWINTHV